MSRDYCIILTNFKDEDTAHNIADVLIKENLAFCVQASDKKSYYKWKDEVDYIDCNDVILNIKAKHENSDVIKDKIAKDGEGFCDTFIKLGKEKTFIPFIHMF